MYSKFKQKVAARYLSNVCIALAVMLFAWFGGSLLGDSRSYIYGTVLVFIPLALIAAFCRKYSREQIPDRIRYARNAFGLSVSQFAELMGVDTYTIDEWESGQKFPNDVYLPKIINELKINPEWFFSRYKISGAFTDKVPAIDADRYLECHREFQDAAPQGKFSDHAVAAYAAYKKREGGGK
jgi:transcriptional regulator with XRE-family HTH domain